MATPHDSISKVGSAVRTGAVREQASKIADDVRELGHAARADAEEALLLAKERGEAALGAARERGEELLDKGRDRVTRGGESLERYVSDHPIKSLLIAAGIGLLIGWRR